MDAIFTEIFEHVKKLEIIDTHEHLPYAESAREKNTDVLKEYLIHYFNRDLVSAGLKSADYKKVIDPTQPLWPRWKLAEPFWEICRHTGYGRSLDIAVREIYGVEKICGATIEKLNAEFKKTLRKPGHFKKVLKEKSRIKISLLDDSGLLYNQKIDRAFFRRVYHINRLISPASGADLRRVEEESGIRITSLEDWLEACGLILDKAMASGAVALKCSLAYDRSLRFPRATRAGAETGFREMADSRRSPDWDTPSFKVGEDFQNFMMHYVLSLANRRHLTCQFHTGLQEGNANLVYNSDPALLSNLFCEYPDVNFDLFHIGYPYQHVIGSLAKVFPNVYIDMCWAHIISPAACREALKEWIDSVPLNKISAFGGDYCFVDGVYGHQYLARENVSHSLAAKVKEGVFDADRAKEIAGMLFYQNPKNLFQL